MKTAVIKTGGKQYLVEEKIKLKVEKLDAKEGDKVTFDSLLMADGDKIEVGSPLVASKVEGKILSHGRGKKVAGVKYKPKTRQTKRYGHRQDFTEIEIVKI